MGLFLWVGGSDTSLAAELGSTCLSPCPRRRYPPPAPCPRHLLSPVPPLSQTAQEGGELLSGGASSVRRGSLSAMADSRCHGPARGQRPAPGSCPS